MAIPLTIESLAAGGGMERGNLELQKVLNNVLDPNTPATATREVTLKLKIKPNEDREIGDVELITSSKLAQPKPIKSRLMFDRDRDGRAVAKELTVGEGRDAQPLPGMHPEGRITALKPRKDGTNDGN